MSPFSATVGEFWRQPTESGTVLFQSDGLRVVSQPGLPRNRRVTLLETDSGATLVLAPDIADRLTLAASTSLSDLRAALSSAGVALHGADAVYYFTERDRADLVDEPTPPHVRELTALDADAFALFEASASEQDRDDAWVALDHWAVVGAFEGDRLVCVASAYPWEGSRLADMGVLTLPQHRHRGHARSVVRELSRVAFRRQHEPQYRCQLDNEPSKALAAAAGLTWFGTWDVVSQDG